MPTTLGDVIDQVSSTLTGFVTDNPMYCTLAGAMQSDTLTIVLDAPAQSMPQGLVEIGNELVHISKFDPTTSTATIPPWGRGQQGTTAAPHPVGSKVTVNPRYPRKRIAQVVNQVISAVCPPLFGVQEIDFDGVLFQYDYPAPSTTLSLLRVESRVRGLTYTDWCREASATLHFIDGSPYVHLRGCVDYMEYRATLAVNPIPLTVETQAFSACGLPESVIDLIVLGAIPRLVSTQELARQQLNSVESSERATLVPAGSGTSAAKFYMQMFADRLAAETQRLRQQYPLTVKRNV